LCLYLFRRSSGSARSSWPGFGPVRSVRSPRAWGSASRACVTGMSRADIDTGSKPGLTSDEHKELVELRREKRRLETENEILKRAAAYFARENALPK
jgi:hypothetical protein